MARKPYHGNKYVREKVEESHEKLKRLAMGELTFPLMGLVNSIFGEQNELYKSAVKSQFKHYYRISKAEKCTIVLPFREYPLPLNASPRGDLLPVSRYLEFFKGIGEGFLKEEENGYSALALEILYPKGAQIYHCHHLSPWNHVAYDKPYEAFWCTPATVNYEVYTALVKRLKPLFLFLLRLEWQHEFTQYFTERLATEGQVARVWPASAALMPPGCKHTVDSATPTAPPKAVKEYIAASGLGQTYIDLTLREIVDSALSTELVDTFPEIRRGKEAVLSEVAPVWVDAELVDPPE
jgi:hypothetical protein